MTVNASAAVVALSSVFIVFSYLGYWASSVLLIKYESVTITIENAKSIVEIAMIFGFIPCFTAPKIAVG